MTMHWIAGNTITVAGNEIQFTNIPQTFSHLQIRVHGRSNYATGGWGGTYFNGSPVAGDYPAHSIGGDGASLSIGAYTNNWNQLIPNVNNSMPWINSTAGVYGVYIWDLLDYTSTTKNKVIKVIGGYDGNGAGFAMHGSGMRLNTAAVTQIQISSLGGFAVGSRADLYGITTNSVATGA